MRPAAVVEFLNAALLWATAMITIAMVIEYIRVT